MAGEDVRLIRIAEVRAMTGLSRAGIYELMKHGYFPRQVQLAVGRAPSRTSPVAWVRSEVAAWVAERIAASRSEKTDQPANTLPAV